MASDEGSPVGGSDMEKVDQEMNAVIENLEKSISRLKGKANDEKRLERCTQLIKKFAGLLESLQLDVASMDITHGEKKGWERKVAAHVEKIEALKVEFNDKRREVQKKLLLKSNPAQAEKLKNLTGEEDVMQLDRMQAVAVGDVLLDKAEKSLARTKKLVVESEQMGINTLGKMEAQNEQMDKIYEDFDEIDGTLARSKRIIGHIAQSAVNDRCIQVLTLLVFIILVVVIVQQFTNKRRRLRRLVEVVVEGKVTMDAVAAVLAETDNDSGFD